MWHAAMSSRHPDAICRNAAAQGVPGLSRRSLPGRELRSFTELADGGMIFSRAGQDQPGTQVAF
jgi:hypothetical protein